MKVLELKEINGEYYLKIKKLRKVVEISMKEFLLNRMKKLFVSEHNRRIAVDEMIPSISKDKAGSMYIYERLKESNIGFNDILNSYNYFVIGY